MNAAVLIVAVSHRMVDEGRVFDQRAAQLNKIKPFTHDFLYTGDIGTATYVNHLTVDAITHSLGIVKKVQLFIGIVVEHPRAHKLQAQFHNRIFLYLDQTLL